MNFDLLEVGHECALSMTDSYRLWGLILRVCSQEGPAWCSVSGLKASVRGYRAPTVRQQVRLLRLGPMRTHTQINNAVVVFLKYNVFGIQKTVQLGVRESVCETRSLRAGLLVSEVAPPSRAYGRKHALLGTFR